MSWIRILFAGGAAVATATLAIMTAVYAKARRRRASAARTAPAPRAPPATAAPPDPVEPKPPAPDRDWE